ncbi:class A beta-lactamase [bacterium]|nr:class A beta-lactamase [bacterium]
MEPNRTLLRAISSMTLITFAILFSFPTHADSEKSSLAPEELAVVKGEVGIAAVDKSTNWQFGLNQKKRFPMQSVCKLPISIAILKLVDQGKLGINDIVSIQLKDLVPYHSPLKKEIKGGQADFSIRKLISYAVRESDNTACDVLIARAGGPAYVSRLLRKAGVTGVRIDRPEGQLQPDSERIEQYLADPRDTATPEGMVDMLEKLYTGKLLSKRSTALILEDLFSCDTGTNRIRAGLPRGWRLAHKTGTGADVSGKNAGTNDVGIAIGPDGRVLYLSIFIKGSKANLKKREELMSRIASLAVANQL